MSRSSQSEAFVIVARCSTASRGAALSVFALNPVCAPGGWPEGFALAGFTITFSHRQRLAAKLCSLDVDFTPHPLPLSSKIVHHQTLRPRPHRNGVLRRGRMLILGNGYGVFLPGTRGNDGNLCLGFNALHQSLISWGDLIVHRP
jgi:hypothetical protein